MGTRVQLIRRTSGLRAAGVGLAAVALLVTMNSPASATTSDLLTPPPNLTGPSTLNINQNSFSVFPTTPSCDATITSATNVLNSLAAAAGFQVSVYSDSNGQPGSLVGSLTGTSVPTSRTITFTGSVSVSSGVKYWIGTRSLVTVANSLPRNNGTQTSAWSWDTNSGNQAYTSNGGSTWTTINAVAFPQLTLTGECSPSTSAGSGTAQTISVGLHLSDGATCASASSRGTLNTWVSLPAATDCTAPSTHQGATLLGWATSPDFPLSLARRQVDHGWGAYEIYDADGRLASVFIPAGRATFLSGEGNLYPIWES